METRLKLTNLKLKKKQIFPTIPPQSTLLVSFQRSEQILYNGLCIGHTDLTHSYLTDHTDPPECTNCHPTTFC